MSFNRVLLLAMLVGPVGAVTANAQFKRPNEMPVVIMPAKPATAPDSAAIVATVERFHAMLEAADTLGVARLLTPDLTVLESGSLETRAEYLAHHLHSDAAFAKAISGARRVVSLTQRGDVAWTIAESNVKGTFRNRPVDSRGVELMVLTRTDAGWMISAIHWSSRQAKR